MSSKAAATVHLSLRNLSCLKPSDTLSAILLAFKNKCSFNKFNVLPSSFDVQDIQTHQNFLSFGIGAGPANQSEMKA